MPTSNEREMLSSNEALKELKQNRFLGIMTTHMQVIEQCNPILNFVLLIIIPKIGYVNRRCYLSMCKSMFTLFIVIDYFVRHHQKEQISKAPNDTYMDKSHKHPASQGMSPHRPRLESPCSVHSGSVSLLNTILANTLHLIHPHYSARSNDVTRSQQTNIGSTFRFCSVGVA